MIIGIGVDIVLMARFESLYRRFGIRLAEKLLSSRELQDFQRLPEAKRVSFLAKHFAAKEAASKALGTGFRGGISMKDFTITRNAVGKPELQLDNVALQKAQEFHVQRMHISFADESTHVVAMVVMEG